MRDCLCQKYGAPLPKSYKYPDPPKLLYLLVVCGDKSIGRFKGALHNMVLPDISLKGYPPHGNILYPC